MKLDVVLRPPTVKTMWFTSLPDFPSLLIVSCSEGPRMAWIGFLLVRSSPWANIHVRSVNFKISINTA